MIKITLKNNHVSFNFNKCNFYNLNSIFIIFGVVIIIIAMVCLFPNEFKALLCAIINFLIQ